MKGSWWTSLEARLCRTVSRSDVFVVFIPFEFSVLTLSLNTHSFFTTSHSLPLHNLTLTSSNKHYRVQIWAWEEQ